MFYIQKKGLCFTVADNGEYMEIQENANSFSASPALSQIIMKNLTSIADYQLRSIPKKDRHFVLITYFKEKDWMVMHDVPELFVHKSGLLHATGA